MSVPYFDATRLLRDCEVASRLALSPATIRRQRFDRRHGLPHWFSVDPVMIGSAPRYRLADVEAWLAAQHLQAK
jgi:predicted DNA-binding transcriptional regulator AlpA